MQLAGTRLPVDQRSIIAAMLPLMTVMVSPAILREILTLMGVRKLSHSLHYDYSCIPMGLRLGGTDGGGLAFDVAGHRHDVAQVPGRTTETAGDGYSKKMSLVFTNV